MTDAVQANNAAVMPSVLYVVATPIGHLADLSERARQVLSAAPWIAAEDTRHTQPLLRQLGARGKLFAAHEHNEEAAAQQVISKLAAGDAVALVSDAGTPAISDPGTRIVARVRAAGYQVVPVPGACAAVAALSAAGLAAPHFLFYGFLPTKAGQRAQTLSELAQLPVALVFYEAPHRVLETVAALAEAFGPERTLVIAREITKLFETIHSLPLGEADAWLREDANRQRGEFVLLLDAPPPVEETEVPAEAERVLRLLLAEGLPVKQAAKLGQAITGASRNVLYERALALRKEGDDA